MRSAPVLRLLAALCISSALPACKGDPGTNGTSGSAGSTGPTGLTGQPGSTGPIGPTGVAGSTGAVGPSGLAGGTGAVGSTGPLGQPGPAGGLGPFGPATLLPTGQYLTPLAVPGSTFQFLNPGLAAPFTNFVVGQLVSAVTTADRRTLALLTSGYNNNGDHAGSIVPSASYEYVFVYDLTSGPTPGAPQVLQVADTYQGLAFTPDGNKLLVSGGGDDQLHVFVRGATWTEASGSPIALGHVASGFTPWALTPGTAQGLLQGPMAQGLAVSSDGSFAVVANRYNDSITVVSLGVTTTPILGQLDLRPGKQPGGTHGVPGGEYPNSVAILGTSTAYVSSERDREVVVVNLATPTTPTVTTRVALPGNPNKLLLGGSLLYVAQENADQVAIIDTASNTVTSSVSTVGPSYLRLPKYKGASPNGLALSPDGNTLYVTNRGTNSIAVVDLGNGPKSAAVTGLLPTAWYPSDVAVSADGKMLYVVNFKSVPGPNDGNCLGYQSNPCKVTTPTNPVNFAENQYIENLNKGGFATLPVQSNPAIAELLTLQVAANNGFDFQTSANDDFVVAQLRQKIQHVIYIVKENRTYDQILGDLGRGNGNPSLAEFPLTTTPSLHALASNFVNLDNFYDSGEVSGNGWPWSTSARESEAGAKMLPVNYACSPLGGAGCSKGRGGSYDWEGTNRNINVGLNNLTGARYAAMPVLAVLSSPTGTGLNPDADVLPGTANVAAPDGPNGEQGKGYLWSAALRKGLTVRNYGFFNDLAPYSLPTSQGGIPCHRAVGTSTPEECSRYPFAAGKVQAFATNAELAAGLTDTYFRGFDDAYPDTYRELEWEREFAQYSASGTLPALSLVRLMADHTGAFSSAIDGVSTPETQVADNDYAVGRLVEAVSKSPFASSTLIFIVEDDAQDGPDHVDAHRSTAFVAGPYVKHGATVSAHYTTVNMLRTITDVLGLDHLGIFDATQGPMTDVFDLTQSTWSFSAKASGLLRNTQLPISSTSTAFAGKALRPSRSAAWWAQKTQGMDFTAEDRIDARRYNRLLWEGLKPGKAYPGAQVSAAVASD